MFTGVACRTLPRVFEAMLRMLVQVHRAGITLVAGTDATAGFSLHRELELYAEAGLPAAEVLGSRRWKRRP